MIRQPEFVTQEVFTYFIEKIKKKKPNAYHDRIQLITLTEGLCCQMLHLGSYDDEHASFDAMEAYCNAKVTKDNQNGIERFIFLIPERLQKKN